MALMGGIPARASSPVPLSVRCQMIDTEKEKTYLSALQPFGRV